MERIRGLQKSTGRWITLAEWTTAAADYDAEAWIAKIWSCSMSGVAELPGGAIVNLGRFDAFRAD